MQNFIDTDQRGGSALEDIDHPAKGNHGPRELHHVGVEGDEITEVHAVLQDFATTYPEDDDDRGSEHEFECRPEHSHEADKSQAAADVFLVGGLEGADLRLLLNVGADHARAGEILLGAGRDVGEHRLNAFKALVDATSKVLDQDAGDG